MSVLLSLFKMLLTLLLTLLLLRLLLNLLLLSALLSLFVLLESLLVMVLLLTHFLVEARTHDYVRGWLASYGLVRSHSLSLIELEHNLKFLGKPKYLVSQIRWSNFGRFSLCRQRAPMIEIGPTSTQAVFGRGKARTMANLGASGGRDEWEEEVEFEVEGELH
jgi:hypothetical protein